MTKLFLIINGLLIISKEEDWGTQVAQSVKHLPSTWVMIPGFWDRVPHQTPCSAGSLLLPLPLPLPCALFLYLSFSLKQMNKILKKKKMVLQEFAGDDS